MIKKVIIIILLFFSISNVLADESEFKPSTQLSVAICGDYWMGGIGMGLDRSFIPHFVWSLYIIHSVPFISSVEYISSIHINFAIKFFFRNNNLGPYLLMGPEFRVIYSPDYGFTEGPPVTVFLGGVGVKLKFLKFLVFDINLSAPTFMIFKWPDLDSYEYPDENSNLSREFSTGSLKMSLGFNF